MGEVHTEEGPKADILVLIEGRARYLAHLGHVKTPEILRGCAAEITRLRVALAEKMVVKVKPLEWIKHPTAEIWRCDIMIGTYKVFGIGPTPSWDFDGLDDKGIALTKTSLSTSVDVAKAAAQADYDSHILSAVEAVPASQIRAEALREAAAAVDCKCPWRDATLAGDRDNGCPEDRCDALVSHRILALIDAPKVTP